MTPIANNFQFEDKNLRVIDQHGDVWFVLKDVLNAMGSSTRPSVAKTSIEQGLGDGVFDVYPIDDALGRNQNVTIINESAVTFLVSRSNTQTGRNLNRWIHGEVLPQIRRTGSYHQPQLPDFSDPVAAARAWADAKEEAIKAEALVIEHQKKIDEDAPKVGFYDAVTQSPDTYDLTQISKVLDFRNMGRNNLASYLRSKGIFRPNTTEPYQRYVTDGHFKMVSVTKNGRVFSKTVASQKGVDYIYKKMIADGYIPKSQGKVLTK